MWYTKASYRFLDRLKHSNFEFKTGFSYPNK